MRAALALSVGLCVAAITPGARADDSLPTPSGSRRAAATARDLERWASSRGFGAAVDFYRRELARRGLAFDLIGPARTRGIDLARFVVRDTRSAILAVHVYRQDGKTWISFVKRAAPSRSSSASPP